jgi:hypothetical protein
MAVSWAMAAAEAHKRPNLFDGNCQAVYQYLLECSLDIQLPSGAICDTTLLLITSPKTISKI